MGGYDKELIRRRFEKAGDTYERYAGMQEYSARRLADIVSASCPDFEDMKVLEIGAGTGSLTRMLTGGGSMVFSHGYYANDIVDTMAPLYRSMGLTPLMGDISSVDIPYDLDAVVSVELPAMGQRHAFVAVRVIFGLETWRASVFFHIRFQTFHTAEDIGYGGSGLLYA